MSKRTLVIYNPSKFYDEIWLPTLWSQSKTYYEIHGNNIDQWHWYPSYADAESDLDKVKLIIEDAQPDIFAISLYVWNVERCLRVAKWVKHRWPKCLIVSGGPQQNTKYNINWFKEHDYIDASLPSECYGELFFTEILDNFHDGKINWELVTNAQYPRKNSRLITSSRKVMHQRDKKLFDYQWSSYANQRDELIKFINYRPDAKSIAVIESTRGCPYGCTYCDWGGGTLSTVLKKDLIHIKEDLDFLASINLWHLYVADANLGIFGDRDVKFIQMLINVRHKTKKYFTVDYGGFAKTNNKINTVEKIIKMSFENFLGYADLCKLSMQTLDNTVLTNINRKNIDLDIQLNSLKPLVKKHKYPIFVEMILGLPGITLDKFYYEMDILGKHNLMVRWYEWILLPEAPAYDPAYRKKYGIITTIKKSVSGWTTQWAYNEDAPDFEIVVGSNSFTTEDYMQMLLSTSMYHAIIQGGLYDKSIAWIIKHHSIGIGQIVKGIYNRYYQDEFLTQWQDILNSPKKQCFFKIGGNDEVSILWYFITQATTDQHFVSSLGQWLITNYNCPINLVIKDQKELVDMSTVNNTPEKFIQEFAGFRINIFKRKKIFGLFNW